MQVFHVLRAAVLQLRRRFLKRPPPDDYAALGAISKNMPRTTFLSLPYEVREIIYNYTLDDLPTIFNTYVRNPPLHSLLLANRQIHDEYAKIYYGNLIFHLQVRRTAANDDKRPDRSGLAQWRLRSPIMLGHIREVMLHFEASFRSLVPPADRDRPTHLRWLADGLAMAPNIEVMHIVFFCGQECFKNNRPILSEYPKTVDREEVMQRVVDIIPWIKECCKPTIFPALMRLVLHIDTKYGNKEICYFMENMADYSWVNSFSRSFVMCDPHGWHGTGSHFSEHVFKVIDKRRRPWHEENDLEEAERALKKYNHDRGGKFMWKSC